MKNHIFLFLFIMSSTSLADDQSDYYDQANKSAAVCVRYRNKTTCNNQHMCRLACALVGGVLGGAYGGTGGIGVVVGSSTQYCHEVCDDVPDCSTSSVCVEYERN